MAIDLKKLGADIVVALDQVNAMESTFEPFLPLAPPDVVTAITDGMTLLRRTLLAIHGQATLDGVATAEAAADAKEAAKFVIPPGAYIKSEPPKS